MERIFKKQLKEDLETYLWQYIDQGYLTSKSSIIFNSMTQSFDVWCEQADLYAFNIKSVISIESLKKGLVKNLTMKLNHVCELCKYYDSTKDICMKEHKNSIITPCEDMEWGKYLPEDAKIASVLKKLPNDYKSYNLWEEMVHQEADEIVCKILETHGYNKGVDIFRKLTKGYSVPLPESQPFDPDAMIPWQCVICRNIRKRDEDCRFGYSDWPKYQNNECEDFALPQSTIEPKAFTTYMNYILEELDADDVNIELVHYNMDKLLCYILESLGYVQTVEQFKKLPLNYILIPF